MTRQYLLTVNGKTSLVTTEPHQSLLDTLREKLGLTGSKKGCDEGECASCTVLVVLSRPLGGASLHVSRGRRHLLRRRSERDGSRFSDVRAS